MDVTTTGCCGEGQGIQEEPQRRMSGITGNVGQDDQLYLRSTRESARSSLFYFFTINFVLLLLSKQSAGFTLSN